MNTRNSYFRSRLMFCSMFLLVMFLTACSTGGSRDSATPGATSELRPSPTPSPAISSSGALKVYSGMGFTIEYPSNWTTSLNNNGSNGHIIAFTDPSSLGTFSVQTSANPGGLISSADDVKSIGSSLQSVFTYLKTIPVAPTTTVGGQTPGTR